MVYKIVINNFAEIKQTVTTISIAQKPDKITQKTNNLRILSDQSENLTKIINDTGLKAT